MLILTRPYYVVATCTFKGEQTLIRMGWYMIELDMPPDSHSGLQHMHEKIRAAEASNGRNPDTITAWFWLALPSAAYKGTYQYNVTFYRNPNKPGVDPGFFNGVVHGNLPVDSVEGMISLMNYVNPSAQDLDVHQYVLQIQPLRTERGSTAVSGFSITGLDFSNN